MLPQQEDNNMTTIGKYDDRKLIIDRENEMVCKVEVIDESGRGCMYIDREDAKKAINVLRAFINSPRYVE